MSSSRVHTTFTGVPPGGWFGEGTALKRETYRYNIQALRTSRVAGVHVDTFHWLLDHSIAFNRFVMDQLNERLSQFIAMREIDRMNNPDIRVARSLAALFNRALYPGVDFRPCELDLISQSGVGRRRPARQRQAQEHHHILRTQHNLRVGLGTAHGGFIWIFSIRE